jgi:hypothetical protein
MTLHIDPLSFWIGFTIGVLFIVLTILCLAVNERS